MTPSKLGIQRVPSSESGRRQLNPLGDAYRSFWASTTPLSSQ